jgi:hypothetical protein
MGEPARTTEHTVVWRPQGGPQTALVTCPVFEVFFGGARGGGKTDAMLGEFAIHAGRYGADAIGLMIRRERTQLIETIERSREIFALIGAKFHEQEKMWRFPNGARLRFAYLERDSDAEGYQGHSYTRVYVEEIGNFPNPAPVLKLMATLRSAKGVPTGFRATGNPGGPGHQWVKARYIDPDPGGWRVLTDDKSGLERVYIPSRIADNRLLLANDPQYIAKLKASGSENLVRAWLEGDWSVIDGAFFDGWSNARHVLAPFEIPADWPRFRAFDWGSARPFSVGWWAIVPEDFRPYAQGKTGAGLDGGLRSSVVIPRGALVRYREWYGAASPNVGLKLTAEAVADGIRERDGTDKISHAVADPAIFSNDGGPSIAERMAARKVVFTRADNKRVSQVGAMGGWDQMRARLVGDLDGNPMIFCFSTCKDSIRTIPALQHDSLRPEDLDTDGEDHAADEWRYACMSRPYTVSKKEVRPTKPVFYAKPDGSITSNMTILELINENAKKRNRYD